MLERLQYELKLWNRGVGRVAGIDEAGRGPLAGPMVVCAVILDKKHLTNSDVSSELLEMYAMINDSKKVTQKRREKLYDFIKKHALAYHIEEISPEIIDAKGISHATQIGFFNSIAKLNTYPDHILTDHFAVNGVRKDLQTNIIRGDSLSITIAAASILAKVYRDEIMINMHKKYPAYGFDKHKGYGTKIHRETLLEHGPCEIHRKSFKFKTT